MFLPREMPLDLGPEHLLGLRLSLNTPVVSTEEVPTGPARAALAVHRDGAGTPTITLAVRPVQSTHAVFYGLDEELRDGTSLAMGVDAALSFGESLGFLFDDDAIAGGEAEGPADALALWNSVVGDDELSKVMGITKDGQERSPASAPILETELGEELLLEELALEDESLEDETLEDEPSEDEWLEDESPAALAQHGGVREPSRQEPAAAAPTPTLTKFRAVVPDADQADQEPDAEAQEGPRRAFLARVRLIKRAAKSEKPPEEDPEPGRTLRLLVSF